MLVLREPMDTEVLLKSEDVFVRASLGPYGQVALELDSFDEDDVRDPRRLAHATHPGSEPPRRS